MPGFVMQNEKKFAKFLIEELKATKIVSGTKAKLSTRDELMKAGLLNKNGTAKMHIVNECHLG